MMTQATEQRILCPICRASNRGDARFCQQCGSDVLLDNIYRLTRVIKEGGMGMVYKAIDAAGVEYAVKEMHDRFATPDQREEGIDRFKEEALLLRELDHPAIPKVYRSFIDEGKYYLAMEFIHGEDLEDVLKRVKRFDEPTVLRWTEQICDVLDYMHGAGLIYRDMKPSNIMLDRDGNLKLVDFGIAKLLQPGQRNTMVGTPGYSPPEQYQGLATIESDVYATAATLHHLLTGRDPRDHPPFTFPLVTKLNRNVSLQTAKAIDKALSMEVRDRFHSVEAFRRALPIPTGDRRPTLPFDLRDADDRLPVPPPPSPRPQRQPAKAQARPTPPPSRPQRRPRRLLRRVAGAAILAAGLGGVGVAAVPEVIPAVQTLITEITSGGASPAPAPATTFVSQPFQTEVRVQLPESASDAEILNALRREYESAAKTQYPGALITPSSPPALEGGSWTASDAVGGQRTYTARVRGYISIPTTQ
ncbi:MAG TPA: serine/threonine-protein kinase [Herpetosiphonaceae bacterium]|nr:serine/threonine-protein kinase [Herpetosiphonaceae bacterium]